MKTKKLTLKFNDSHPELKRKEIFLINVTPAELQAGMWTKNFHVAFHSVRVGNKAYDNKGKMVKGFKPLFGVPKFKRPPKNREENGVFVWY